MVGTPKRCAWQSLLITVHVPHLYQLCVRIPCPVQRGRICTIFIVFIMCGYYHCKTDIFSIILSAKIYGIDIIGITEKCIPLSDYRDHDS